MNKHQKPDSHEYLTAIVSRLTAYTTPQLTPLGQVCELTASGSLEGMENNGNDMQKYKP